MDIKHLGHLKLRFILPRVNTVYRTHIDAGSVLRPYARLANDISHRFFDLSSDSSKHLEGFPRTPTPDYTPPAAVNSNDKRLNLPSNIESPPNDLTRRGLIVYNTPSQIQDRNRGSTQTIRQRPQVHRGPVYERGRYDHCKKPSKKSR